MLRVAMAAAALAILSGCNAMGGGLKTTPDAADTENWAKFVPWDSKRPEVKKTGTGMEYIVLGSGAANGEQAKEKSSVEIHYEGRLNAASDKPFDSSFERKETATFPVGAVIPGFSEALKMMRPGDAWLVYIPAALGYGPMGAGADIPPNADLVFEIEMKAIKTPLESNKTAWTKYSPWNSSSPDVKKTGTGLEYVVLDSGPASGVPAKTGQQVEVYFEARRVSDGVLVESSFANGETVTFPIDALTPGFEETMKLMRPGDRWLIMMPPKLMTVDSDPANAPDTALMVEIALEKVLEQ
jgi:FKBP-type peptidyl-prolyl cis-trans isomerase